MSSNTGKAFLSLIEKTIRHNPQGVSEYEILRQIEPVSDWSKQLSSDPNLLIFQKHFLLMNALYRLQEQIYLHSKEILVINPLCIQVHPRSNNEACKGVGSDSSNAKLKEYYLDFSHFESASAQSVDELLAQFWMKFQNTEKKDSALLLLELTSNASEREIKDQYKKLAHQHHPDKGGDAERFVQIQEAWEILKT